MNIKRKLLLIYKKLDAHFGDLKWWPGDDPFEVMVGAILTQNTNWGNVEKAIRNLKAQGLLSPGELFRIDEQRLAGLIRPSGYYNIKARRLKHFISFLIEQYAGDLQAMLAEETGLLRGKLLSVKGIGEETADSILLYAAGKPIFVVDAYTRRILERHGLIPPGCSYGEMQKLFMKNLQHCAPFFNQYHALIVNAGKYFCRKAPRCGQCPLAETGAKIRASKRI
jgi:endonuclease-3 related protein